MGKYKHKLGKLTSIKQRQSLNSTINTNRNRSEDHPEIADEQGYTSLKDIIENSLPHATSCDPNGCGFDSYNISFRNELLTHAASAYVQSAAILANRNRNFFSRFWEDVKEKVSSWWCSFRRACRARKPPRLHACFEPLFRFLNRLVSQIARAWHQRI